MKRLTEEAAAGPCTDRDLERRRVEALEKLAAQGEKAERRARSYHRLVMFLFWLFIGLPMLVFLLVLVMGPGP